MVAVLAIAGCATTPAPVTEVTRFHLGQPIPGDTIALTAGPGVDANGLEFRSQAAVVGGELAKAGFQPAPGNPRTAYLAVVSVAQSSRMGPPRRSPLQIGIGGGSGGYGGGVGGGVSVPIGGRGSSEIRTNELSVQIRRRSDNSMVWEGKVVEEIAGDAPGANLNAALPGLSQALFAGFPGPSGQTVRVKTPR